MVSLPLWKILFTFCLAVLTIFIRSAHLQAIEQQKVANTLNSYLKYWRRVILESELEKLIIFAENYADDIIDLIQEGGTLKTTIDYDRWLTEDINSKISSKEINIEELLPALESGFGNSDSNNRYQYLLDYTSRVRAEILDAKTFPKDSDLALLESHITKSSIELKMLLCSLISGVEEHFIIPYFENGNFDNLETRSNALAKMLVISLRIITYMKYLNIEITEQYLSKKLVLLTAGNLFKARVHIS